MNYDAVLGHHQSPLTCGVAKFNHALARQLGIPFDSLEAGRKGTYTHPLVSVKFGEMWAVPQPRYGYDLLLHDRTMSIYHESLISHADRIFYADEIGCPSTLSGHSLRRGEIHVLTFGMAHKRAGRHFEQLKALLDGTGRTYTIGVSSAIHEGSPWAETWAESDAALRSIFGDALRQYGFLADDGLVNAIDDANVVALFYEPAVRANNTTLWAALERAAIVITNLDAESPAELIHGETVYDLARLTDWPDHAHEHRRLRYAGQRLARGRYGWDRLVARLASSKRVEDSITVSR